MTIVAIVRNASIALCALGIAGGGTVMAAVAGDHGSAPRTDRPELSLGRSEQFDFDPPEPGSYSLPIIKDAGDGDVLTADGRSRRLRDVLAGRISLVSFIYTSCADPAACPLASGVLYRIKAVSKQDPLLAENLRLVTFSFDPERDTPTVMASYGKGLAPDVDGAEWIFLTTAGPAALQPILADYGQRVDRKRDPDDPLGPLAHLVRVFLVDRGGRLRNIYSFDQLDPRLVLTDVRTLLLEEAAVAAGK